ncbi:MAG: metal-dependent transcriptional regulator [Syntrophorhabdaceae bacterium]|nr:metal-dependent transcriptional regulator [Syntrophorhabdaceae bacterium]NLF87859.1 metal-dependent transcriptional regulator [Candidatus Bathyarchaeota archaeon]
MLKVTDRAEDYLRVIDKISKQGYVGTGDVAAELRIKPASVFEMLSRLQKQGLIVHQKYGSVTLTKKGQNIANVINKRHETFLRFLEIILVPHDTAIKDASILEHKLDYKTILQFSKFVDFMALERPRVIKKWREFFKYYSDGTEQDVQIL